MQPKILDFGIAAITNSTEGARLTRTGSMVGTPQYVSPEQAMGLTVGASSDIYTLGLILYEMVTGSPPFEAGDTLSLLEMHRSANPLPPTVRNPHLPAEPGARGRRRRRCGGYNASSHGHEQLVSLLDMQAA